MAVIGVILLALLLGYHYMNQGLFRGAVTLITMFLAVLAGMSIGPGLARYMELDSPERFAGTVAAVGILAFGAQRAFLGPLDMDIDFSSWLERLGGAITGACSGVLLGGFTAVCLLCLNSPSLSRGAENLRHAADMTLGPCRIASALFPGPYLLTIDGVVLGRLEERNPQPDPPPADDAERSAPDAHNPTFDPHEEDHTGGSQTPEDPAVNSNSTQDSDSDG